MNVIVCSAILDGHPALELGNDLLAKVRARLDVQADTSVTPNRNMLAPRGNCARRFGRDLLHRSAGPDAFW